MTLPVHTFADLFWPLQGDAFHELVGDIRDHGVRDQIVLFDGQILDGRNRINALTFLTESGEVLGDGWGHRAGEPLDVEMLEPSADNLLFRTFNPAVEGDPLQWVVSKNLVRRHLTDDQRRMVGARLVNLKRGRPPASPEDDGEKTSQVANISRAQAAEMAQSDVPGIDRARAVIAHAVPEVISAVDAGDLSVSAASTIAKLPEPEQPSALERALPNGSRAIMSSRVEPDDSLDYFPTPPWATRALLRHVLPQLMDDPGEHTAWEPACGEGHIAEVLEEYFGRVVATDVHDYGYSDRLVDFLDDNGEAGDIRADWIITNPPFAEKSEAFVLRALERARYGVAMFVRLQWLETIGRYENIFRDRPPTLIAFFAERVNLCKGRWDPEGGTATAYIWLVWDKYEQPRAPFWIPPGSRESLSRSNDVARFTQHPVARRPDHVSRAKADVRAISVHAGQRPDAASLGVEPSAGRLPDGRTSDAGAAELLVAPAPIPREEASGTAREAPTPVSGREPARPLVVAAGSDVGVQPAPPQLASSEPHPLDLPEFLRRSKEP
ncbi:hypothetical protein ACE10Z_23475 [Bradyrhizobium sp. Pha-3]|uniref:hypothetical protein n=1 Tax=Bradyrhizobium sp. Pha-3 TaxID=208375 RepID=UPI0035D423D4